MIGMARSSTQILYRYLPGAIFEHPEYGLCRTTDIVTDVPRDLNTNLLFDEVSRLIRQWEPGTDEDNLKADHSQFPDPKSHKDDYIIGSPKEVMFEPFPLVIRCSNCGRIRDLARSRHVSKNCVRCKGGSLLQLPYVQIHECGRIESLYANQNCPEHGSGDMVMEDTGRFATVRWKCIGPGCDGRYISQLQKTPCRCPWGKRVEGYEPFMRNARYNDTNVFMSQLVNFANLPSKILDPVSKSKNARCLAVGRALNLLDVEYSPFKAGATNDLNEVERQALESEIQKLEELSARFADPLLTQLLADKKSKLGPTHGASGIAILSKQIGDALLEHLKDNPRLIELATLIDGFRTTGYQDSARFCRQRGDETGAILAEEAQKFASSKLGFLDINVIHDFPLALAAVGYSRGRGRPGEATLNTFPAHAGSGKVPLFAVTAQTEAILIRLNPVSVAEWLIDCGLRGYATPQTLPDAWRVLHSAAPGLQAERWDANSWGGESTTLVRTLLHTVSHVLLRKLDWSGFDPESIGEHVIPEGLAIVLHANSFSGFTIGGLTTLFEQRLHQWLTEAREQGGDCIYDPICSDQGGACSGCLHRRFNCQYFNNDLNRSLIFGGTTPAGINIRGFWQT